MTRTGADLANLLLSGFRFLAASATEELARRGHLDFRPAHDFAMRTIAAGGNSASELARRLAITKQAAAKTVVALEERGYAERVDDPSDARRKILQVTPLGYAVLREGTSIFEDLRRHWESQIGEEELARIEDSLAALVGAARVDFGVLGPALSEVEGS